MKVKLKDLKNKAVLVITILFIMGTVFGCGYQTEEPATIEDKQPSLDVTNESIPEVKDIPYTPDNSTDNTSSLTLGQRNALSSALSYLDYTAFSHDGLIEQLEFEGYSHEEALYAADNCGADWNEQAAKSAKSYLDYSSFSRSGLIEQLEFEGFTSSQAIYAADTVGYEDISIKTNESLSEISAISDDSSGLTMGQQNAVNTAESYLDFAAFSYNGLVEQLEFEGYSHEDALYAADNCGADWNEQAAKSAKSYLDYSSFSRSGLIEQLEFEGFTSSQAAYGADAVGY